jgi:hypothetical protein
LPSYIDQSKEEILASFLAYPSDEFMLVLRNNVFMAFSVAKNAADILDEMLDEPEFNKETARNLPRIIRSHSDYLFTVFDAAIEYDKIQRTRGNNASEKKLDTEN